MRRTLLIGAMVILGTACGGTTQDPGVMGVAQLNDLSVMFPLAHDQAELDSVANELNGRPRQTLGWVKPSEAFARLVASVT